MTSDTINRTEETLCINSIMADLIQKLVKSTKIQTKGSDVVHERVGCLSWGYITILALNSSVIYQRYNNNVCIGIGFLFKLSLSKGMYVRCA